MINTTELLLELSNLHGIPGQERQVANCLQNYLPDSQIDAFGNLYHGDLASTKPKVAIYSHMDEVGFFVKTIDSNGFIYFEPIGGWWSHVVLGQRVQINCRRNGRRITGIVGTLPKGSVMGQNIVPISEMYIDLGAESRDEVLEAGVQPGDMITPISTAEISFNQKKVFGKALDNRVACTIMTQVLLQDKSEKIAVIGVATAQEEAGTRGSKVAAQKVAADVNIVIDVANGKDTPAAANPPTRILGQGPGLVLADKTALAHLNLLDFVKEQAEKANIPFQFDLFGGGGTDAGSVQLTNGKPTMVISVPVRYCHSWNSVVAIRDVEAAIQLVKTVISALNQGEGDFFGKF